MKFGSSPAVWCCVAWKPQDVCPVCLGWLLGQWNSGNYCSTALLCLCILCRYKYKIQNINLIHIHIICCCTQLSKVIARNFKETRLNWPRCCMDFFSLIAIVVNCVLLGINVVLGRLDVNRCDTRHWRKTKFGMIMYVVKLKSVAHFEFVSR